MFSIEFDAGKYKEAMETAIWAYKVLDEGKDSRIKWIERCYTQACKDKSYKKKNSLKEIRQLYKEYIKSN